jgi:4-alpha-glucanotransferase
MTSPSRSSSTPSRGPSRRTAGLLIPLFSIRTRRSWGIGDIADLPELARWVAEEGGQKLVQLLPVCDLPGNETSPYSAATSFGIDPMYIAVDRLADVRDDDRDALLGPDGHGLLDYLRGTKAVDYPTVRRTKTRFLRAAAERFHANEWANKTKRAQSLAAFIEAERAWLADYAFFRALKTRFGDSWWRAWPAGVRDRDEGVLREHEAELRFEIFTHQYLQWIAHEQWSEARRIVNAMGVELMGDLPFMVGVDSADVWGNQGEFHVDATLGVPGDAFSPEGQDWGLPSYDWPAMDATGLSWVKRRAAEMGSMFDRFRVDHLVGYYRMYVRPKTGEPSHFVPGSEREQIARGEAVLRALVEAAGTVGASIVAEDLGTIPPFVRTSLDRLAIPGYKVLCWEKDGDVFRDPARYPIVSLATSGTHDTDALATWWETLSFDERKHALNDIPALRAVAGLRDVDRFTLPVHDALFDALYGAASELVLLPIQDVFGMRDRINTPGMIGPANWSWRLPAPIEELRENAHVRGRLHAARDRVRRFGRSQ